MVENVDYEVSQKKKGEFSCDALFDLVHIK